MPRLSGVKERRHQPFWDTLIRTMGNPGTAIAASTVLFGNANIGNKAMTNLQVAGQLAADQTYIILALRVWLHFNGTNRRLLYLGTVSQLYWTLTLGDKPSFTAPTFYFPAGGGIWGFDSGTSIFNNGDPTQEAIMKLARPIIVPVRQNFAVQADWYVTGGADYRAGNTSINTGATDDEKIISFFIDGLQTRDVQ
jgi:hypothetical protein